MSLDDLIPETQRAFGFLAAAGYAPAVVEQSWPESLKGGFTLTYAATSSNLRINYWDMELTIQRDGEELFGAARHDGFAGNMFSRENLPKCIDRIAAEVRSQLET